LENNNYDKPTDERGDPGRDTVLIALRVDLRKEGSTEICGVTRNG